MDFTYQSYKKLIKLIQANNYSITSYSSWEQTPKCVILRHDIDYDISKALKLAQIEHELGVASTYFVLITSDFYNVLSLKNLKSLNEILSYGHTIGLHFDEMNYTGNNTIEDVRNHIIDEADILSRIIDHKIDVVSMHRPSKMILDSDLSIPGIINSYGNKYFKEFKYVSDSRRRWREPIENIICSGQFNRLHILTHAFWYEENDTNIHDSLLYFINHANFERYETMKSNITDLNSIINFSEVLYE